MTRTNYWTIAMILGLSTAALAGNAVPAPQTAEGAQTTAAAAVKAAEKKARLCALIKKDIAAAADDRTKVHAMEQYWLDKKNAQHCDSPNASGGAGAGGPGSPYEPGDWKVCQKSGVPGVSSTNRYTCEQINKSVMSLKLHVNCLNAQITRAKDRLQTLGCN